MSVQDQITNLKDDLATLRTNITAWKDDQAAKIADLKTTYLARLDGQRDKLATVTADLTTARRQLRQTRKVLLAAARRVRSHHNECTCNCSW